MTIQGTSEVLPKALINKEFTEKITSLLEHDMLELKRQDIVTTAFLIPNDNSSYKQNPYSL